MSIATQYQQVNTVEAVKLTVENAREVAAWCGGAYQEEPKASDSTDVATWVLIPGLFGGTAARTGEYVIKNRDGQFFRALANEFEQEGFQPVAAEEPGTPLRSAIYNAATAFDFLLDQQRVIEEAWGRNVDPTDPAAVSQYVRDVVLCATDELHEVLGEVNWKPWKDNRGIKDIDKYREEMADVLHFILDLYLAAGLSGSNIIVDYLAKNYENLNRVKSMVYRAS